VGGRCILIFLSKLSSTEFGILVGKKKNAQQKVNQFHCFKLE